MDRFYKVKFQFDHSSSEYWMAVKANSEGDAVVRADTRSIDSSLRICSNSVTEIEEDEYRKIIAEPRQNYSLGKR